jgi:hypothetical protein
MAAHIGQPIRSRRFIKIYLSVWALLAVAALAFLAMLAFQPQAIAPPPPQQAEPDRSKSGPAESKALAEARSIRGSLTEIRKDVAQLQEAVGEQVINEKVTQTRLTALEERVSTIDQQQQPVATPAPKAADKTARNAPDPSPAGEAPAAQPETPARPPFVPVETGSLTKEKIVFGEAVVTPADKTEFAVQLAAGTSLQALRQSWGQLTERHAGALATLQPRVVAPRSEGGLYRLLAGPVPTKAEAEKICSALGVGPKACFATSYTGAPLEPAWRRAEAASQSRFASPLQRRLTPPDFGHGPGSAGRQTAMMCRPETRKRRFDCARVANAQRDWAWVLATTAARRSP